MVAVSAKISSVVKSGVLFDTSMSLPKNVFESKPVFIALENI